MIPAQRQKKILESLTHKKIMSFAEIGQLFDVSHMTIRRDITHLEKQGKLVSVAGGVQLVSHLVIEPSHDAKLELFYEKKELVAKIAAKNINTNTHSIYLDAGTTCLKIAQEIAYMASLLFITNDLKIADYLLQNSPNPVILIGGEVHNENYSSLGNLAAEMIKKLNIDLAFVSTSSWNQHGISTPDARKVDVKKAIMQSSLYNILVSDSSKYGRRASYHIVKLDAFDKVITDDDFSATAIKELKMQNINVENNL